MAERLAVAAVVTANGRLDQALTVVRASGSERKPGMAPVNPGNEG